MKTILVATKTYSHPLENQTITRVFGVEDDSRYRGLDRFKVVGLLTLEGFNCAFPVDANISDLHGAIPQTIEYEGKKLYVYLLYKE